jgi:hypothetical protein
MLFETFWDNLGLFLCREKVMKPNQPTHPLPDFDADLEDDVVWNLIDDASPADPPPRFVEETLRRVRLEEDKQKSQWWKLIFAPKPLIGTAGVALAAVAIVISLPSDPSPSNRTIAETPQINEDFDQLEDSFATELLSGAAEDPTLLSDEEIVALLY